MSSETAVANTETIGVVRAGAVDRAAIVATVNRALAREDALARQIAIFRQGVNLTDRLRLAGGRGWFAPLVRDMLGKGVSVVVNGIGPSAPAARAVERLAGIPAAWVFQQNLYITPREVQGFVPHCDPHIVVVAQLFGRKQWRIYDKRLDNPVILDGHKEVLVADPGEKLEIRQRLTVEPGDLFVIPRGTFHAACAEEGASVHLAIGCAGIRPVDVLWELAGAAMARGPLRADGTPEEARAAAVAFLAETPPPAPALPRNPQPEIDVPAAPAALSFEDALRVP